MFRKFLKLFNLLVGSVITLKCQQCPFRAKEWKIFFLIPTDSSNIWSFSTIHCDSMDESTPYKSHEMKKRRLQDNRRHIHLSACPYIDFTCMCFKQIVIYHHVGLCWRKKYTINKADDINIFISKSSFPRIKSIQIRKNRSYTLFLLSVSLLM